jgi:hypothetical protein
MATVMTEELIRGSISEPNTAIIRVLAKRRPPFQREGQTPCTRYIKVNYIGGVGNVWETD